MRGSLRTLRLMAFVFIGLVGSSVVLQDAVCFAQAKKNPEDERPVDELANRLQPLVQKSEWDQVIKECDKVLEADPKKLTAHLYRGIAHNGLGEYDEAIKDFGKVTDQKGRENALLWSRADAFSNRSVSYYAKGDYLKAIDSAYFALLEKSEHTEALNNRGLAYIARHQYDKAIGCFNRMIQIDPKLAVAYSNRGYVEGLKGQQDQNLADQKKALELDGNLAVAYQRRAHATVIKGLDQKNIGAVFQDLDKAIQLKPNFLEALCDRAELYALGGDATKAMADIEEAIKQNPKSSKARVQKGRAYMAMKKSDVAINHFDKAIELNAKDEDAYLYRGYAHFALHKYDAAASDFTKAIELNPKSELAYKGRIDSYKKLGKKDEEKADVAKLNEVHPQQVKAKSGKKSDKRTEKSEDSVARFKVESKPVDSSKLRDALESAKKIDQLVEANYAKTNTKPNAETTDAQFVRRIYLDITGTIPTYQQTLKFLNAKESNKRSLLIDELLSGDGYARHQFNYWVDVLRYIDNLSTDVRGEPYRQWIKQSLAENMPWDKFVHSMLTAEGLIWDKPMAGYYLRDSGMPLDNMNNSIRIFLGTRIGCAQCHDHPFDRWTQKEFYEMAAFTFGTVTSTNGGDKRYWQKNPTDRLHEEYEMIEQEEEERRQNFYKFERIIAANMKMVNDQTNRQIQLPKDYKYSNGKPEEAVAPKVLFGQPVEIKPGETPRQGFARWATSKDNPRFALTIANRLWKQAFGQGQIEPVDDMMDGTVAENPELMKFLESEMKRLDFDMKEYLRIVFNTATYQREACADEVPIGEPYHFPGPVLRRMTAEQAWDSFLTLAVADPDEYRELPAKERTGLVGADLSSISAENLMENEKKAERLDGTQWQRQAKYVYQGVLLARASELPSPVPPNHFLRIFGQSDRELISSSSTTGSVPQVLFMFNGPITHMLLEPKSTIYNNVVRHRNDADRVKAIFITILNREPDRDEMELGKQELRRNGAAGAGNLVWSLVNTREFLFIQ